MKDVLCIRYTALKLPPEFQPRLPPNLYYMILLSFLSNIAEFCTNLNLTHRHRQESWLGGRAVLNSLYLLRLASELFDPIDVFPLNPISEIAEFYTNLNLTH